MGARCAVQAGPRFDAERTIQDGRQLLRLEAVERDAHHADSIVRDRGP